MKYSDQVVSALRSLHPEIRREIRRAMRNLEAGKKCNTKPLRPPLDGFWRLRVGTYRLIYRRHPKSNALIAEFLDSRMTIYEAFRPSSGEPPG